MLEQENISNVQDRGYLRTRVENHCSMKTEHGSQPQSIVGNELSHIGQRWRRHRVAGQQARPHLEGQALVSQDGHSQIYTP